MITPRWFAAIPIGHNQ